MATRAEKFAEFDKMIAQAKADKIDELRIHHPEVLGDNYEELVENLNRLSDAGVALVMVPRSERKG